MKNKIKSFLISITFAILITGCLFYDFFITALCVFCVIVAARLLYLLILDFFENYKKINNMRIKISKGESELLKNLATIVTTKNNNVFSYIPFWFQKTETEDVYELISFDRLPKEVTEHIQEMRDLNPKL